MLIIRGVYVTVAVVTWLITQITLKPITVMLTPEAPKRRACGGAWNGLELVGRHG